MARTECSIPELAELDGQDVVIETVMGVRRTGHLSAIRVRAFRIGVTMLHLPKELILDHAESEPIPWEAVSSIHLEE